MYGIVARSYTWLFHLHETFDFRGILTFVYFLIRGFYVEP
jgi:hypothetical protein